MKTKQNLIGRTKIDDWLLDGPKREKRNKKIKKALRVCGYTAILTVSGFIGLIGLEYNINSDPKQKILFPKTNINLLINKLDISNTRDKYNSKIKQLAKNSYLVPNNNYQQPNEKEIVVSYENQPTLEDMYMNSAFATQPREILPEKKEIIEDLVKKIQNGDNSRYQNSLNIDDKLRIKQEHRDRIMSYKYAKLFGK